MADRLFNRIAALLKISLDDLLMDSSDQDAAAHWIAEMESGLAQAKDAVASAVAQERQLERQWQEAQTLCDEWDAKTDAALQAGDDARARQALKRKINYERAAAEARERLECQRQAAAEMKASLGALQAKIAEARRQVKRR